MTNEAKCKKNMMDVQEQQEFNAGHIPGAVLLPVETIDEDTADEVK